MSLCLVAEESGQTIPLSKPVLLVGRHPECDIQLDSKKISRRHCCIAVVDQQLAVRDLGSMNGIRINGERVLDGRLQVNDELTIGNLRYRLKYAPSASDPRSSRLSEVSRPAVDKPSPLSSKVDLLAAGEPTVVPGPSQGGKLWNEPADAADPLTKSKQ